MLNIYQDRLFYGATGKAFDLGTVLTGGWFWMRSTFSEQQLIYRGRDGSLNPCHIAGFMDLADSEAAINSQALPASSVWHYVRTQIRACGRESAASDPCIIYIDADGDMIAARPNAPGHVGIRPLAGGKFRLRWIYNPADQQVSPSGFRIYADTGSGFDYTTPTATVGYSGAYAHSWDSDAYSHGSLVRFVIRAYSDSGGETQNSRHVAATADDTGPAAITGLRASYEVVQ